MRKALLCSLNIAKTRQLWASLPVVNRGWLLQNANFSSKKKMSAHWGYSDTQIPPAKWHTLYPIASSGQRQSPIDIDVRDDVSAGEGLDLKYNPADITSVVNNGHSVTFEAKGNNSVLSGGPLKGEFKLLQFHFHWGSDDSQGSEHTWQGKKFAAEIHLVHLNMKYSSFNEALNHSDGLCVVGAFLEASGDKGEEAYDRVAELMKNVTYKNQRHNFEGGIDARELLPKSHHKFTTYEGSLTTPPLSECVQWVNLESPVEVSRENLEAFRSLCANEEGHGCVRLVDNFRPVQPAHGRQVCIHKMAEH